MPLKLIPPKEGKTPYWYVRGTHHGVYVERSTKATDRATASKILRTIKDDIERGIIAHRGEPTFLDAAVLYMAHTGTEDGPFAAPSRRPVLKSKERAMSVRLCRCRVDWEGGPDSMRMRFVRCRKCSRQQHQDEYQALLKRINRSTDQEIEEAAAIARRKS
jgi:hypothetical protein